MEITKSLKILAQTTVVSTLMFALGFSPAYGIVIKGGDCPWRRLPERIQLAALEAGLAGGPASMMSQIPADIMSVAEEDCGLDDHNKAAYRRAEAGYLLQLLSERWLAENYNINPSMLDAAWSNSGYQIRKSAKLWAIYLVIDPYKKERMYLGFLKVMGIGPGSMATRIKPQILTYIQGRALRNEYEPEL